MAPLSYLEFLLLLVVPPPLLLWGSSWWRGRRMSRSDLFGLGIVVVLALGYTISWDNSLIGIGVWEYGPGTVAATLWRAPIEEYAFIILQSVTTALWLRHLGRTRGSVSVTKWDRGLGLLAGGLIGLAGVLLLRTPSTFYLGAILTWGAPILALQWAFGWPWLWRARRRVGLGVLVPTLYFAAADRFAIGLGIWTISPRYTTGVSVFGLPLEEGAFFLLTNILLVQGLVLYGWVVDQWN